MRTRTFSEEEKEEIKQKMIEAGLPLLREKGIIHMSITKLTEAAGIGKSTFYNFYETKEDFVQEMLQYYKREAMEKWKAGLNGRKKYSKEEGIQFIRSMIFSAESAYQHFSREDELALMKMHERNGTSYLNLEREMQIIDSICSMIEGVRDDLDYAVISNLMKIIVFASEQRDLLHESGYERTIEQMTNMLLGLLFE